MKNWSDMQKFLTFKSIFGPKVFKTGYKSDIKTLWIGRVTKSLEVKSIGESKNGTYDSC